MAKRKTKHLGPKRKRLKRPARLQAGSSWLLTYTGTNLVKGYMKWYAVDEICALTELKILGVDISESHLKLLKKKAESKARHRQIQKDQQRIEELKSLYEDSDDTFYFIAGYTPWGFPYGVTWEEIGETPPWIDNDDNENKLPF